MTDEDREIFNLSQVFLEMLRNKEQVIETVIGDVQQAQTMERGLNSMLERMESGEELDGVKARKVILRTLRRQSQILGRLAFLMLVYVQGENFNSDSTRALMRMGLGREAVREMWKRKMKDTRGGGL